jgi:glyoxylase-like metal-dependent hydrolase (beta-lactamase superfamily II)
MMKRRVITGMVLGALALLATSLPALAAGPAGMKLYVFTSGSLGGFPKAALQIGGQGNVDWAPVGFYVIVHPKGIVMFDTGNNDKTITDAQGWWGPLAKGFGLKMTQNDAMAAQLGRIGLKTSDVKYVGIGHMHLDHGGNISQFPNATFIVQNDEMQAAWWPDPGYSIYYIPGDFADSKKYNMIRLNGDLDLFGDGSVEFRRAPGHTPGSMFAVVRLPKTGTVVLTSDVVYFKESLDKNLIPPIPGTWSPMAMYESYQKLRLVRDGEGASLFYGHDPEVFKATKQAPAFYE